MEKRDRTDSDELYFECKFRVTSIFLVKVLGAIGGASGAIYLAAQLFK